MYVKLFTSIYQGTLRGNSKGLLVFTNLLAHADKEGVVDMHPRAIAEEIGLSIEEVRETLIMLESPDNESRSPEEQGRRIIRLDEHRAWGWVIVNYEKYRKIRNQEDRREQNRQSQKRFKERNKPQSAKVSQGKPQSAHAEAEAEAYAKADTEAGNTEEREKPNPKISRTKKPVRYPLPSGFSLSDKVMVWAKEKGFNRLEEHLEAFKAKAAMSAYCYADWDLAFMEAIREDWAKLRQRNGAPPAQKEKKTFEQLVMEDPRYANK